MRQRPLSDQTMLLILLPVLPLTIITLTAVINLYYKQAWHPFKALVIQPSLLFRGVHWNVHQVTHHTEIQSSFKQSVQVVQLFDRLYPLTSRMTPIQAGYSAHQIQFGGEISKLNLSLFLSAEVQQLLQFMLIVLWSKSSLGTSDQFLHTLQSMQSLRKCVFIPYKDVHWFSVKSSHFTVQGEPVQTHSMSANQ